MTRSMRTAVSLAAALCCINTVQASNAFKTYNDETGDQRVLRTDPGADGPLNPNGIAPDMLSLTIGGWAPPSPTSDPYTGAWSQGPADFVRIDVVFQGLINPPGPLGLGAQPYDPFAFGDSPVYGSIELDIDRDKDTGGECDSSTAALRYMGVISRFGARPEGSVGDRAALSGEDLDANYASMPQFERSGTDFLISLCGCSAITVIDTSGDVDGSFDAGDAWIVESRFFQRAGGYEDASGMFGGSFFGLYDPITRLRFSHDAQADRTTVTLVYPLTMQGAAALNGEPLQQIDLNVANHNSVIEALDDVIVGADIGGLSGCARDMTDRWEGEVASDHLDPTDWDVRACFAMPYANQQPALYVWTDHGFDAYTGDIDGDGVAGATDRDLCNAEIASRDGGASDADGMVNGEVELFQFASNFSVFDLDYDGVIGPQDLAYYAPLLPGDVNGDCAVNFTDLNAVLAAFGEESPIGDANGDGVTDFTDLNAVLSSFGQTCR